MTGRIVTSTYRYKRPPRKKQAVKPTGPAVVTRRARLPKAEPAAAGAPPPANDDGKPAPKKPAIVRARKPSKLRGELVSVDAPETPDYEATTAHFRAVIARKLRK